MSCFSIDKKTFIETQVWKQNGSKLSFVKGIFVPFSKAQTLTLAMYFGIVWMEPRLLINDTATEWTEFKFGPPDEVNVLPEAIDSFWYMSIKFTLEKKHFLPQGT